ncbi:hypothetical protein GC170_05620 [bacterium]|nr:hypothetical protein [bacterium]
MKSVEQMYMERVMAMTPDEKLARAGAMLQLARTAIARSIVAEHGEMPEMELKHRVALRLYGSEPVAALIEEEIRSLTRNSPRASDSQPQVFE